MAESFDTVIYLLRKDLRLEDNETLVKANKSKHMIPLYCFDPNQIGKTKLYGLPKPSGLAMTFIIESLQDVRSQLKALGSDLVLRKGKTEEIIMQLVKTLNLEKNVAVMLEKEVLGDDATLEETIKTKCGVTVIPVWGKTLYHVDDLPFAPKDAPDTHMELHKAVVDTCKVRSCIEKPAKLSPLPAGLDPGPIPTLESLGISAKEADPRSTTKFQGGETVALAHMQKFLWGKKDAGKGMDSFGSKMSPWFSQGCLSPRKVYWAVKTFEKEQKANPSTGKMLSELLWRDYFQYLALKYKDKLLHIEGIKKEKKEWKTDVGLFNAWKDGKTGIPYIDANMREVAATGFMSNKGREAVASFLTRDLQMDWRMGAEWFEAILIDHEMCNNYGNWVCAAGLGLDPELGHKLNVVESGQHDDANGDYVRKWIPELDGVKSNKVHKVWSLGTTDLKAGHVELGKTYPKPITELMQ